MAECVYCHADQRRMAPVTDVGRALRQLYDRYGANSVLTNPVLLSNGLGDVITDTMAVNLKKLKSQIRLVMDSGAGALYKEQIAKGAPDRVFSARIMTLLTEDVGLSDKAAAEMMSWFDEMIGWKALPKAPITEPSETAAETPVMPDEQRIYDEAVHSMASGRLEDFKKALRLLKQIPGYKDADELMNKCASWIKELKMPDFDPGKKPLKKWLIPLCALLAAVIAGVFLFRNEQAKQRAAEATRQAYALEQTPAMETMQAEQTAAAIETIQAQKTVSAQETMQVQQTAIMETIQTQQTAFAMRTATSQAVQTQAAIDIYIDPDLPAPYRELITRANAYAIEMTNKGYSYIPHEDFGFSTYANGSSGYAVKDIDNDGIKELLFLGDSVNLDIWNLYTISNGQVKQVLNHEQKNFKMCSLRNDGTIGCYPFDINEEPEHHQYSYYKLDQDKLEFIESTHQVYEGGECNYYRTYSPDYSLNGAVKMSRDEYINIRNDKMSLSIIPFGSK